MKAYSVILGIVAACTAFSSAWARPATHSEWDNDDADSTVAVIAWFNKRDTMTYWINESSWKVKDGDTTKTRTETPPRHQESRPKSCSR